MSDDDLTLVLDIGKSRAKLLMIDALGEVVEEHARENRSVTSTLGYPALDVRGLTQWVARTLAGSSRSVRCVDAIASTHGAAIVALGDGDELAWDPIDYEFEGCRSLHDAYQAARDSFAATFAPDLPAGLNAARQLHWLQLTHPTAWARTRMLVPYPQYWAWWLSGIAASELSSLGCHTQLWRPGELRYTDLAKRFGWAERFARIKPAWSVLGPVLPERARETGLPVTCRVHVGVHDSNACLARLLHGGERMTLVSSGTWVVVMAPGASSTALDPRRDMLANVSVRGERVPTARFMGGRELEAICAGAAPALASEQGLAELMCDEIQAVPSFASQGGPFGGEAGGVLRRLDAIDARAALGPVQRASLAALYCAQVTAWLLERLEAPLPLVVDGPFADNALYLQVLAALLPAGSVRVGIDPVEGTARGAWMLAHWSEPALERRVRTIEPGVLAERIKVHYRRWQALLPRDAQTSAALSR